MSPQLTQRSEHKLVGRIIPLAKLRGYELKANQGKHYDTFNKNHGQGYHP